MSPGIPFFHREENRMGRRGIIVHPHELDDKWVEDAAEAKLNVMGLHPVGGTDAHLTLESAIHFHLLPESRRLFKKLENKGMQVEYEAHAMRWLLPRDVFASAPHFFRMDEEGSRKDDFNLCPSQPEALDFIADRAEQLARMLTVNSDRYFFWLDDVPGMKCHCEKCRNLSASDQQLLSVNAMVKGIRRYNAQAQLCYLAYIDAIHCPEKVEPEDGVFLEYAPFYRDSHRPLFDPECEKNVQEVAALEKLLQLFGKKDAQVLEYWMDNSRFSGWKKPPKYMPLDEQVMAQDVQAYRKLGFESITSFGCYLGQDYRELYGEAPVIRYGELLREEN